MLFSVLLPRKLKWGGGGGGGGGAVRIGTRIGLGDTVWSRIAELTTRVNKMFGVNFS